MEVQADAEHEQDDADLGELLREAGVADEAGGERADGDAGEHVADERWQAQAVGEETEREGDDHGRDDGGEELGGVLHGGGPHRRRRADLAFGCCPPICRP